MGEAGWRIASARVAGTSHVMTGLPCQDAVSLTCEETGGAWFTAAIADGAGSAARSDRGSEQAARAVETFLSVQAANASPASALGRAAVLAAYRDAAAEIERLAAEEDQPVREYACTLLAAYVDAAGGVFAQVGDGAIVIRMDGETEWRPVFWPQHGRYANETNFIVGEGALDAFEHAYVEGRVAAVAMFTDGLENLVLDRAARTAPAPFFEHVAAPVRRLPRPGWDKALSDKLAAYLSSKDVSARTDDDITLVVASHGGPA